MKGIDKLNVAVIGCVEFSQYALEALIRHEACNVSLVITRHDSKINSDFANLQPIAEKFNIPSVFIKGNDQEAMASVLNGVEPDVVFCVGWSYLLKAEVLNIPKFGVVGYHPAKIPDNRGRHPLIWAMALGLKETGSTFFLMDEGADSGRILSQEVIPIKDSDYARDLYDSMLYIAISQLERLISNWQEYFNSSQPQQQDGNVWRKRKKCDGKIDWRMSSVSIVNLIRALSKPYPGAHFEYDGSDYIVWKASVVSGTPKNLEPGKLLEKSDHQIIVKCGEGAVRLESFSRFPELRKGDYL